MASWRARAFQTSYRLWLTSHNLSKAVHDGIWLALLDPDELYDGTVDDFYGSVDDRYLDPDYNESGLYLWERAALEKWFADQRRVVLIAAGGGREALALVDMGYEVDAYECHPKLRRAARRLVGDRATVAPIEPSRAPTGNWDGAIVGWGAYTHIRGSATRVQLLRELADGLPAGGPILFSFLTRHKRARRFALTARIAQLLAASASVEVGDTLHLGYSHFFTREEVEAECAAANLALVHYGSQPYGHAVARRR